MTDRVTGIAAAGLQSDDPAAVAARWSEIAEIPLTETSGHFVLPLDNPSLRFVPCRDGRPEGIGGTDLTTAGRPAILAAAEGRAEIGGRDQIRLFGMRITLI